MNWRRENETENGVSLENRENNSLCLRYNLLITNLLGLHLNELLLARFSAAFVKVNRVPKDFKFMIICEIVKSIFFIFLCFLAGVKIIQILIASKKKVCAREKIFFVFDGKKLKCSKCVENWIKTAIISLVSILFSISLMAPCIARSSTLISIIMFNKLCNKLWLRISL